MLVIGKGLSPAKTAQRGINMVDLMMWLVIAALMMAAAIQSILYYQQATYVYHAKSDLAGAHQWLLSDTALNSKVPKAADMEQGLANGDISLTTVGDQTNIGLIASMGHKYCVGVKSATVSDLSRNVFYLTSDEPSAIVRSDSMPEACGEAEAFAPDGTDTSGAVAPAQAPVVTGEAVATTTAKFQWSAIPGAASYKVEKKINDGGWSVEEENHADLGIFIDANSGDSVTVRVTAINTYGQSDPSDPATVVLPTETPSAFVGWGVNNAWQLSNGTTADSVVSPVIALSNGVLKDKKIDYIRSGQTYSCALSESKVYCWGAGTRLGRGSFDTSVAPVAIDTAPIGSRTITSLSVGNTHACLIASGEVFCWGDNYRGKIGGSETPVLKPQLVSGELAGKNVTSVDAGDSTTCAIAEGKAYCWGENVDNEVRSGAGSEVLSPIAVDTTGALNGVTITEVAPSARHTCVTGDGKVYCWGNAYGLGATPAQFDPTGLMNGKTVTALKSGNNHTCAIADGQVYCWGENQRNVLANDSFTDYHASKAIMNPYGVFDRRVVKGLSVGGSTSCVITEGKPYCWGYDSNGQVGNGTNPLPTHIPGPVDMTTALNGKTAINVSVGWDTTFAGYNNTPASVPSRPSFADSQFSSIGWGYNNSGTLGNGTTSEALSPTAAVNTGALTGKKISHIDGGSSHTCAVSEGEAYCWGWNPYGQVGDGATGDKTTPYKVFSDGWLRGKTVTQVSANNSTTCAIADERLYCWGVNNDKQLGEGITRRSAPVPIGGALADKKVTDVDVSDINLCAVADGKAYCWGDNMEGQLGVLDSSATKVSTPTLVNDTGVLNGKTVTDIETTSARSCVIADGKAYCWGYNRFNQLGANTAQESKNPPVAVDTSGVLNGKTLTSIRMSSATGCVLDTEGITYCWGRGTYGQLGAGSSLTQANSPVPVSMDGKKYTTIVGGTSHYCALATDEKVYCWGDGERGGLGTGDKVERYVPTSPVTSGPLGGVAVKKLWSGAFAAFVGY